MIIILGGVQGSGRRRFARALAEELKWHYYDLDAVKRREIVFVRRGMVKERLQRTTSDPARRALYTPIIQAFPRLSKMYPNIVMDDRFHREIVRSYFFKEAEQYFGKMLFVWVESSQEHAEERFARQVAEGQARNLKGLLRRRADQLRHFQEFTIPALRFTSRGVAEEAEDTKALLALISAQLKSLSAL